MKKHITAIALSLMLILPQYTVLSAPYPTQDTEQLRLQDMLMLFLIPNIYEAVGNFYYPNMLKIKPEIEPWRITVIDTQRMNGFRGFILSITIEVEPSLGHHVPVGKDRITFRISVGPSVKMEKYMHLTTYKLPSDLQEWVR